MPKRLSLAGLMAAMLLAAAGSLPTPAQALQSKFFKGHPCAEPVAAGKPYDMDDPKWLVDSNKQNKDVCAYRFFAAFFMLGYNTEMSKGPTSPDGNKPHLHVLAKFQKNWDLPIGKIMNAAVLAKLDQRIAALEPQFAKIAVQFPLYGKMLDLHPNDTSKDALAALYTIPMLALPPKFKMLLHETEHCINGQCVGDLVKPDGSVLKGFQPGKDDYRFVGAYFEPKGRNSRLPSAAVFTGTVLHEFAHYVDGRTLKDPKYPVASSVDTLPFFAINYEFGMATDPCGKRKNDHVGNWITLYGYYGAQNCPAGMVGVPEAWADAFSTYVTSGKAFRAAAAKNARVKQQYEFLRSLFGVEYDTDLIRDIESGCKDAPGSKSAGAGYTSCAEGYVWNWQLKKL